jgi:hypothetical protein
VDQCVRQLEKEAKAEAKRQKREEAEARVEEVELQEAKATHWSGFNWSARRQGHVQRRWSRRSCCRRHGRHC